ncbi:MAG: phosphopantetheine-binding protein [Arenicellales bacterium]
MKTVPESAGHEPTTDTERVVMEVWREEFKLDTVARDDDLLDLGINSLAAAAMCLRLGELFKVEITPANLVLAPTVAELAALIDERLAG